MLRKLLVRLLICWKKEFFNVVEINGCHYIMGIHMYEPADKFIARAEKALQGVPSVECLSEQEVEGR